MESPALSQPITEFIGGRNPEVEKVSWSGNTVWVDRAKTSGFRGVRESVWNFHIGGYQVCEKWLKDRKGRTLSKDDISHYQKIVVALAETIRLMGEIDEVIEQHGGWPGAFAQGEETAQTVPGERLESTLPAAVPDGQPVLLPVEEVTEHGATSPGPNDLDREEVICCIRQMFADSKERERELAIDALAHELGYQRTETRIHEELDNVLRTAVRRGILANEGGTLHLTAGTIEQYDREALKEQFLASLSGRQWVERDDAIRAFARWMGFRRTGQVIDETARSLINGLLREGRLERNGSQIRRG
jgi:hypothetical protein